jgi:hypothetical protein
MPKFRAVQNQKIRGVFYPAGSPDAFELTKEEAEQLGDNVELVVDEATLYGSSVLPAMIAIAEGKEVQLGEVVAAAHTRSGLTAAKWNKLAEGKREALLTAEIELMKAEAAKG